MTDDRIMSACNSDGLKPCPFCGSEEIFFTPAGICEPDWYMATCGRCCTNSGASKTEALVRERWNTRQEATRTEQPADPQEHEAVREAIARIIDPLSFKSHASLYDYCIRRNDSEKDARQIADLTHKPDCDKALEKADAILALTGPQEHEAVREAIARIGRPLRVEAFNAVMAGKADFAAMIVRDDEPGCSSILAQQMGDQMAEDIIAVLEFAAAALTGPRVSDERVEGWKLVPVEPTSEMLDAAMREGFGRHWADTAWSAMLAASPRKDDAVEVESE